MSYDYASHKVSEALRLNAGNPSKARRQIQAWFYEDAKLLMELTRPHWNGIVAYAVDRAVARLLRGEDITDTADGLTPQKAKAKAQDERHFGKEILRSFVSERAAVFGHEHNSAPAASRPSASQNHVDAIHLMAAIARKKSAQEGEL